MTHSVSTDIGKLRLILQPATFRKQTQGALGSNLSSVTLSAMELASVHIHKYLSSSFCVLDFITHSEDSTVTYQSNHSPPTDSLVLGKETKNQQVFKSTNMRTISGHADIPHLHIPGMWRPWQGFSKREHRWRDGRVGTLDRGQRATWGGNI